jgi:hypothetical protein
VSVHGGGSSACVPSLRRPSCVNAHNGMTSSCSHCFIDSARIFTHAATASDSSFQILSQLNMFIYCLECTNNVDSIDGSLMLEAPSNNGLAAQTPMLQNRSSDFSVIDCELSTSAMGHYDLGRSQLKPTLRFAYWKFGCSVCSKSFSATTSLRSHVILQHVVSKLPATRKLQFLKMLQRRSTSACTAQSCLGWETFCLDIEQCAAFRRLLQTNDCTRFECLFIYFTVVLL